MRAWYVLRSACVRAKVECVQMCGVKCAECVQRSQREYPSELVRYSIRYSPQIVYNHRVRVYAVFAVVVRIYSDSSACHKLRVFGAVGRPRLSHPCKLLRLNRLAITQYKTYHMEWVFTL
jgi:hypothetical protein